MYCVFADVMAFLVYQKQLGVCLYEFGVFLASLYTKAEAKTRKRYVRTRQPPEISSALCTIIGRLAYLCLKPMFTSKRHLLPQH